jgi:2-polyprenyl-6-methoxyphenol hydroxylase-like FAD-dependent oxidoreductase
MTSRTVLISGAGIAGPALAHWLGRHGFRPTVVEVAPGLSAGGNAVDVRGGTQLSLLARMGVLDDLRRAQTGGTAMRFVAEDGRTLMALPAEFAGGDLEVLRGDLAQVLYEHSRDGTEYLFGDRITALTDTARGVDVRFASGTHRTFDLVVAADGVHSAVRALAFGPESGFVRHLGYYVAGWTVPAGQGDLKRGESLLYNVPGRMASVGADHRDPGMARAFVAFASPRLEYDRHDLDQQRAIIRRTYAGLGWQVPRLLAALPDAPDLYFDAICRVDARPWTRGRIALIGDAACGATLGGMGTGTALVAAYVLAGELAEAGGDHTVAYPRYERLLRDFARRCQKGGDRTGAFLAPRHAWGIRLRNGLLNRRLVVRLSLSVAADRTNDIDLPRYQQLSRR